MKSLHNQIAGRCAHFTGILDECCAAGVRYNDVREKGKTRLPCLKPESFGSPLPPGHCDKLTWPTKEEVAAEIKEIEDAGQQYVERLAAGLCPVCGKEVTKRRQVGRCVYGEPCGHRMYQGRA